MKLLIIDDEIIIREGLSTVIKWEENGFTLLNPAASAEEALMRIPIEKPDIIMTDIRMTGKTGLDLAREVKQDFPETEIVILSGYEEFAYAQQAMREGISDYLLKTSRPGDIMAAAMRAQKRIMVKRAAEAHQTAFRSKLLEKMLTSDSPITEQDVDHILQYYPELRMASEWESLELWLVTSDVYMTISPEADKELGLVGNKLRQSLDCAILDWNDGWLYIFRSNQTGALRKVKAAVEHAERILHCRLFATSGYIAANVKDLRGALRSAEQATAFRFLAGDAKLIRYDDIKNRKGMRTVCSQEEEAVLTAVLRSRDREKLDAWIQKTLSDVRQDPEATPGSMKSYLHSFLVAGFRWLERAAASVSQSVQELQQLEGLDLNELAKLPAEVMTGIFSSIMSQYDELSGDRNSAIARTVSYIREHLDQSLTLSQVAAYVHMNPNYFSELFKRETGKNYIEFVTEARIEWAIRLLRETPAKVSEIAKRVGYEDLKHFNRMFKRYTGETPSFFRERSQ
ncbi:response regulator transcription factor [Paenibacillus paeoniae]|uniref:Helix-turn-helix domain-containing protein n=1 Tax=Paenibacillus paeoniae TaxID=2292705 RepID=A0A371P7B9_9BACL|nr:helix-turn-helix domain-containing protein [Paenibacillus paeoniae]REK71837.1 helix-turn-helix domain-containing protein [Paenibacillus paeoniae]